MSDVATATLDASRAWVLSPEVSLRDEAFGALAYHHGNRRLVFLKSPTLVALVRALDTYENLNGALDALVAPAERSRYLQALSSLEQSGLLRAS